MSKKIKLPFICTLTLTIFVVVIAGMTANFDGHNKYGDAQSFMGIMHSGKLLSENGYIHEAFTPTWSWDKTSGKYECCRPGPYTHFPPLTTYLAGTAWDLGIKSLLGHKSLVICIAILGVLIFASWISLQIGPIAGIASVIFLGIEAQFYRISVTQYYILADFLFLLCCLLTLLYIKFKDKRLFYSLFLFFGLCSYSSFEYTFPAFIFASSSFLIVDKKSWFVRSFKLGLAAVLAMTFHFFSQTLGSWAVSQLLTKT